MPALQHTQDTDDWIENHIEELEREANSDAPHAWVAEAFLQTHRE
jgi:hypothetical protein